MMIGFGEDLDVDIDDINITSITDLNTLPPPLSSSSSSSSLYNYYRYRSNIGIGGGSSSSGSTSNSIDTSTINLNQSKSMNISLIDSLQNFTNNLSSTIMYPFMTPTSYTTNISSSSSSSSLSSPSMMINTTMAKMVTTTQDDDNNGIFIPLSSSISYQHQQQHHHHHHQQQQQQDESISSSIALTPSMNLTFTSGTIDELQTMVDESVFSLWTFEYISIIIFYSLIILVGLTGNLLVCRVAFGTRQMRTTTNLLIASLACSDIVMIVFNIPFNVVRMLPISWPFWSALCILAPLIQYSCVYVSTFTMTLIALHRLWMVRQRSATNTEKNSWKKVALMVMGIWLIAITLSIPHASFNRVKEKRYYGRLLYRCSIQYPNVSFNFPLLMTVEVLITQYLLPLSITLIVYVKIGIVIARQGALICKLSDERKRRQSEAKRRRIFMLALAVATFATCWAPINLYILLVDMRSVKFNQVAFIMCHWFAMSSVCYNPIIYCWLNEKFRNGALQSLRTILEFAHIHFMAKNSNLTINNNDNNNMMMNANNKNNSNQIDLISQQRRQQSSILQHGQQQQQPITQINNNNNSISTMVVNIDDSNDDDVVIDDDDDGKNKKNVRSNGNVINMMMTTPTATTTTTRDRILHDKNNNNNNNEKFHNNDDDDDVNESFVDHDSKQTIITINNVNNNNNMAIVKKEPKNLHHFHQHQDVHLNNNNNEYQV
ncbi:G-protein coupled receptor [Dermatophagoides farinae]|uniref:G-protein coupled receptor n=1 Tax=Dermatophagoides farinae TaxID=6954 RepID=A0A922L4X2_DERFA|nr:G-protein coupled receptor [Dermatophagoides farinae]